MTDDRKTVELWISVAAMVASLAWSVIHIHFDPLPNPDAVAYLRAAQAWVDGGGAAAATVYPLPLYSILIGSLSALTGFSLLTSAQCFNALCIALLIVALQRLSRAFGAGVRVQCIVVVLVLLLPELNGYRGFLLRDFGYWLFATLALTCLVRYAETPNPLGWIAFSACCGIAAAFRFEAIPLIIAMPAALLLGRARRPLAALALYIPVLVALSVASLVALVWPESDVARLLSEAMGLAVSSVSGLLEHARAQLIGFSTHVLNPHFHDYAAFGLAGGLAAMIIVHVVNAASVPLFAIAAVGAARDTYGSLDRRRAPILCMGVMIALLGLAAVLLLRGIIQTRYAMPVALLIIIVAAFIIDVWYRTAVERRAHRRILWLSLIVIAYLVAENAFALVNSKHYYVDAARWLAQHTPREARIFSTDSRIVYLADRPVDWREAEHAQSVLPFAAYDYFMVRVAPGEPAAGDELDRDPRLQRVARFVNRHGDAFLIYRKRPLKH